MEKHCFTADIEHEDQRIDRYLTEMLPEQSQTAMPMMPVEICCGRKVRQKTTSSIPGNSTMQIRGFII